MTRPPHLSSGINRGLDFLISDNWPADQALAVVERLDDLRARICMHYGCALYERLRELYGPNENPDIPGDIDRFVEPF